MKRVLAATALLALASCSTDVDPSERPHFWNGSNNLTLFIFDGLTGAGVDSARVRIQVGPTALNATAEGNTYYVGQIPAGTFPIFIEANDYLDFVATRTFANNSLIGSATPTITYEAVLVVLFPVRSVEEDITVQVYEQEDGKPVPEGKVVATMNIGMGVGVPVPTLGTGTQQLAGTLGYLPRTIVVPIANGSAVLPKDQLVFGATYNINVVAARNADNEYLQPLINQDQVTAGDDFPQVVIFMGPPAETPVALLANNEDGGTQAAGLVVTFPYPVEVCSDADDHSWVNRSGNTDGDSNVATPDDDNPVTHTLTEGGEVLTLTQNYETGANNGFDAEDDLRVEFFGVRVRIVGSSTCMLLTSIELRDTGNTVDGEIFFNDVP